MKTVRVYEYEQCSTCKKAVKFLKDGNYSFERVPIVESPPSEAELREMLSFKEGDIRKLFNTSGILYREMGLSEKLKSMSQEDAIQLLSKNGKLVKRPFLIIESKGEKKGTVGFNSSEWGELLSKS